MQTLKYTLTASMLQYHYISGRMNMKSTTYLWGGLAVIAGLLAMGLLAGSQTPVAGYASLAAVNGISSDNQTALAMAFQEGTYSALVSKEDLFSKEGVEVLFSPAEKDKGFKPIQCTFYCKR